MQARVWNLKAGETSSNAAEHDVIVADIAAKCKQPPREALTSTQDQYFSQRRPKEPPAWTKLEESEWVEWT